MFIYRVMLICMMAMVAGCSHDIRLQADHGGFLSDEEIRPLDAIAQATPATSPSNQKSPALPEYVFSFRPDFDVTKVANLQIMPMTALTREGQEIAKDLVPANRAESSCPSRFLWTMAEPRRAAPVLPEQPQPRRYL